MVEGLTLLVEFFSFFGNQSVNEMIEDLLPAAFNAAQTKAKELHAEAMQSLTGGMSLPGLQDALAQFTETPPEE